MDHLRRWPRLHVQVESERDIQRPHAGARERRSVHAAQNRRSAIGSGADRQRFRAARPDPKQGRRRSHRHRRVSHGPGIAAQPVQLRARAAGAHLRPRQFQERLQSRGDWQRTVSPRPPHPRQRDRVAETRRLLGQRALRRYGPVQGAHERDDRVERRAARRHRRDDAALRRLDARAHAIRRS